MSAFGSGPSNGQFWFGGTSFPGFLYKKNVGVGTRRSKMINATSCNNNQQCGRFYTQLGQNQIRVSQYTTNNSNFTY